MPWKRCQSHGELGLTSQTWYTHVILVVYWKWCRSRAIVIAHVGLWPLHTTLSIVSKNNLPCLISSLWLYLCRIVLHKVIGRQWWRVDIKQDWDLPELMAGRLSRRCTHLREASMSSHSLNLLLIKAMSTLYFPLVGEDTVVAWLLWLYSRREWLSLVLLAWCLWERASPKEGNKNLSLYLLDRPAQYLRYQGCRGQILFLVRILIGMSTFE